MHDRNLARGLFIIAFALIFGLASLRYPTGRLSHAGPGLFPLLVSCLLFLIGVASVVRSRLVEPVPLAFNPRNIALILASLSGFALISGHFGMVAGIPFLVFCASFAGSAPYSVLRNLKISAGLIAIALAFQKLLGFDLPLW